MTGDEIVYHYDLPIKSQIKFCIFEVEEQAVRIRKRKLQLSVTLLKVIEFLRPNSRKDSSFLHLDNTPYNRAKACIDFL